MERLGVNGKAWSQWNRLRVSGKTWSQWNRLGVNEKAWSQWKGLESVEQAWSQWNRLGVSGKAWSQWNRLGVNGTGLESMERLGVSGTGLESMKRLGVNGKAWSQWNRLGVSGTGLESVEQAWSQWNRLGVNEKAWSQWNRLGVNGKAWSQWNRLGVNGKAWSQWNRLGVNEKAWSQWKGLESVEQAWSQWNRLGMCVSKCPDKFSTYSEMQVQHKLSRSHWEYYRQFCKPGFNNPEKPISQVLRDEDCPSMIVPSRPWLVDTKKLGMKIVEDYAKSWAWILISNISKAASCLGSQCVFAFYGGETSYHRYLFLLQLSNLLIFLWLVNFSLAVEQCTLAGTFSSYYWTKRKPQDIPPCPLLSSFSRAIRVAVQDRVTDFLLFLGKVLIAGGVGDDLERNDGSSEKPFLMSPELHRILGESQSK
ncbi:hypothetical protein PAMA_005565 [Pampus argenteus]